MDEEKDLEMLRSAIEAGDLESAKSALQSQLQRIDQAQVANLVIQYVQLYVPRFESLYPEETWIEECLQSVQTAMFTKEQTERLPVFPHRSRKYDNPITRAFLDAISSLWSMVRWKDRKDVFAEYASNAISSIITVIRVDSKNWVPQRFVSEFEQSANSIEFGRKLWLDLCNRLLAI